MIKNIMILFFLSSIIYAKNCHNSAVTQSDMSICSFQDSQKADAKLNTIYKKILSLYKNDPLRTDKIRKAERAWINFRDAQIEMKYPKRNYSFYSVCVNNYYKELTEQRIIELQEWIEPSKEYDICAIR